MMQNDHIYSDETNIKEHVKYIGVSAKQYLSQLTISIYATYLSIIHEEFFKE